MPENRGSSGRGKTGAKEVLNSSTTETVTRAGFVTICGPPNAGKSTLSNLLLGEELSIVTSLPQTTRKNVLGILTKDNVQAVFVDTPGVLSDPGYTLHERLIKNAEKAVRDADLVLALVPLASVDKEEPFLNFLKLLRFPGKLQLILSKSDLAKGKVELPEKLPGDFPPLRFSAKNKEGLEQIHKVVRESMPEGPFLYPEDVLTNQNERFFVADIIRKKIFELYKQEIPYSSEVVIEGFKDYPDRSEILALIYLERPQQKGILIGKDGRMLKQFTAEAKKELVHFLGRPIKLDLWIKVQPGWRKNLKFLRELGY